MLRHTLVNPLVTLSHPPFPLECHVLFKWPLIKIEHLKPMKKCFFLQWPSLRAKTKNAYISEENSLV